MLDLIITLALIFFFTRLFKTLLRCKGEIPVPGLKNFIFFKFIF